MQGGVKEDSQASFQHATHHIYEYFRILNATTYVTEVFPGRSLNLPLTQHSLTYFICQSSQIQSVSETEAELAVPNFVLCSSFSFH